MKKKLFFVALAAAALASCSQNETVEVNNGQAIGFRTAMGNRAVETTVTNLDAFNATALDEAGANYFANAAFTKQTDEGNAVTYTSNPVYYWPLEGSLTFHAYAPATMSNYVSFSASENKVSPFTPALKFNEQVDFIYATNTGNRTDNETSGVALTFDHKLAQIEVKAKNTNTGYDYKVRGVCLGNIGKTGSMSDINGTTWTLAENEKATYSATYAALTLNGEAKTLMESNNAGEVETAMLIPQQLTAWQPEVTDDEGAWIGVLVDIDSKDGAQVYPSEEGQYVWVAVPVATNWLAGNKYTYVLDFSNGAGNVAPDQPDPDEGEDKPVIPENPGEGEILSGGIFFTVSVNPIVKTNPDIDVDMKDSSATE